MKSWFSCIALSAFALLVSSSVIPDNINVAEGQIDRRNLEICGEWSRYYAMSQLPDNFVDTVNDPTSDLIQRRGYIWQNVKTKKLRAVELTASMDGKGIVTLNVDAHNNNIGLDQSSTLLVQFVWKESEQILAPTYQIDASVSRKCSVATVYSGNKFGRIRVWQPYLSKPARRRRLIKT